MTEAEFFLKCEYEGMGYTLTQYFSPERLASIDNPETRALAIQASEALRALEARQYEVLEALDPEDYR